MELTFEVTTYPEGDVVPVTPRIEAFVRRWAARWEKRYGRPPAGQHPFPFMCNYTFVVDFEPDPEPLTLN